jgi:hypothetical protein
MKVLLAKSTFLHQGAEVEPGDTLRAPCPEEEADALDASHFTLTNLAEAPAPEKHPGVASVKGALAVSHGGGWYTLVEEDGTIIEDKIQGEAALQEYASKHSQDEEEEE